MQPQPLVSIGIPTFNRDSSLRKAIKSVLDQDYSNFELVISDNASTDSTQSICLEFCKSEPRIRYIRQEINLGASINFNEVLKQSQGEFFMWLGDDDWLDSLCYLSECLKVLIEQPEYSLVSGKVIYFINGHYSHDDLQINLNQEDGGDRLLSYYRQVGENGIFYGVMRRSQISKISIQNTMGGDWMMIAAIAFLGKVKTIPNVSIIRVSNWTEDYFKKLAIRLNLSRFQASYPYFSIAFSASNDIRANLQIYGCLSPFQRFYLSQRVLILLIFAKQVSIYKSNYLNFARWITPKWAYPKIRELYRYVNGKV